MRKSVRNVYAVKSLVALRSYKDRPLVHPCLIAPMTEWMLAHSYQIEILLNTKYGRYFKPASFTAQNYWATGQNWTFGVFERQTSFSLTWLLFRFSSSFTTASYRHCLLFLPCFRKWHAKWVHYVRKGRQKYVPSSRYRIYRENGESPTFILLVECFPTDPITNLELQNPSHDVLKIRKISWSWGSKMREGRPCSCWCYCSSIVALLV